MDNDNQNADVQLVRVPTEGEASVEVTYANQHGNLSDPVSWDATPEDVVRMAQEALRGGDINGVDADPGADLSGYKVDRVPAKGDKPNRLFVRPKTEFGSFTINGRLEDGQRIKNAAKGLVKAARKVGMKKSSLMILVSVEWDKK
jgi:hypothetical protein